ncbi:hypothetical protein [Streptomyces acidicola]|uniref:hypothetical protein n=1 Tax=Streptomyces acidicola TaxID=2596892 RepID=UPI003821811C
MSDNALWIASLTAGTAVLASWVTSWGTTRAARIQADTVTTAQREERRREARHTRTSSSRHSAWVTCTGR